MHGAHVGIALDGDADRLMVADERGALLDGDQLMALVARSWSQAGRLVSRWRMVSRTSVPIHVPVATSWRKALKMVSFSRIGRAG